ncbi:uncharacterized protein F5891DRAFT_981809 [Suillus fuscotomentosus]|uniref:Uncharacterized protein n=1 Tax=Suillus fuscotomentosus TaxID=1912939 RepID=A0AAD4E306_9AGAM|nr:uncharacterized protein F5891DRAFT_981809 [Suillus fuscotomentosus]KAG1898397.1 hypothetical protein F5891DRAFT_981809 [Suillus fuscotomentosus]
MSSLDSSFSLAFSEGFRLRASEMAAMVWIPDKKWSMSTDLDLGRDFNSTTSDLGGDTEGLEGGGLSGLHTISVSVIAPNLRSVQTAPGPHLMINYVVHNTPASDKTCLVRTHGERRSHSELKLKIIQTSKVRAAIAPTRDGATVQEVHQPKDVSGIHSEMVSDVKSCAGAIFGLNPEFFVRGYPHDTQPECCTMLVNPRGEYTKFTPILFLHPECLNKDEFLKTAKLVQLLGLKSSAFGKSSLSATYAPAPKTNTKLWQLWNTTPGMIAAAAVVAIFVLLGDKDLYAKGEKSNILYHQYHNYYRQHLMTGGAWTRDILTFFNNALFPETSSSHVGPDTTDAGTSHNSLEEELEHSMEEGGNGPAFQFDPVVAPVTQCSESIVDQSSASVTRPPSASVALPAYYAPAVAFPPAPVTAPVTLPSAAPIIMAPSDSISSAMQDLTLAGGPPLVEPDVVGAVPPKPKPKPRQMNQALRYLLYFSPSAMSQSSLN